MEGEIEAFALDLRRDAQADNGVDDLEDDQGDDGIVDNDDDNAFALIEKLTRPARG